MNNEVLLALLTSGGVLTSIIGMISYVVQKRADTAAHYRAELLKEQAAKREARLAADSFLQQFGIEQIEAIKREADEQRTIINSIMQDIEKRDAEIDNLTNQLEKQRSELKLLQEENKSLKRRLNAQEDLKRRIVDLEAKVKELTEERDELKRIVESGKKEDGI